jgi:hypothetical protein
VEWLDQKSPVNHMFKGFYPTDLFFPQLIPPNPVLEPRLLKKIGFPNRKSPFLNVV